MKYAGISLVHRGDEHAMDVVRSPLACLFSVSLLFTRQYRQLDFLSLCMRNSFQGDAIEHNRQQ